jgi:hypothetical protein
MRYIMNYFISLQPIFIININEKDYYYCSSIGCCCSDSCSNYYGDGD